MTDEVRRSRGGTAAGLAVIARLVALDLAIGNRALPLTSVVIAPLVASAFRHPARDRPHRPGGDRGPRGARGRRRDLRDHRPRAADRAGGDRRAAGGVAGRHASSEPEISQAERVGVLSQALQTGLLPIPAVFATLQAGPESFVTVLAGRVDPDRGGATLVTAGHPPPIRLTDAAHVLAVKPVRRWASRPAWGTGRRPTWCWDASGGCRAPGSTERYGIESVAWLGRPPPAEQDDRGRPRPAARGHRGGERRPPRRRRGGRPARLPPLSR